MTNLDELYDIDDRADAIATYRNGVLVCLAGPGTGKTFSLLKRIGELTTEQGTSLEEIAYLTFVKAIAEAFRVDYEQEFWDKGSQGPRMSTLHSFACRLIRSQGFREGYVGQLYFMSVADRDDVRSEVFLNDLLPLVREGELRTVPRLRELFNKAKQAWRDNADPALLGESIPDVLPKYFALSKAYRLVDWDHTIPLAHALFQRLDVPPRWVSRIKHYLVDEYQDFNKAEQAFIATLSNIAGSMVIVGDDDQSLYSGRGGSPDGLRELYYSDDVDKLSLVRCYRCKPTILKAANTFLGKMRSNPRLMRLRTKVDSEGQIECYYFKSRKAEVRYLTGFLNNRINKLPEVPRPKDGIVCLFPTRKSLQSYMDVLMKEGVSCYSRLSATHPDRAWLELALGLVVNPGQRFIERLLLEDFSDIKPRHKAQMVELILDRDISPSDALRRLLVDEKLSASAALAASAFHDLCQVLSSREIDAIAAILAKRLPDNVPNLREQLMSFIQRLDEMDPSEAIEALCDALIPESAQPSENLHAVLFSTMHGSKGLTKKTVVMPGLEDAWLPDGAEGSELGEKKRLFYVALTRATDEVLITYPKNRPQGDPLNYEAPGRREICHFVTQSGIYERYKRM